jgi:hypothetical protein
VLLGLQATALEAGAEVLKLSPAEGRALEAAAPGQALVHCAGTRTLAEVVASREEERLATTKPEEIAERDQHESQDRQPSRSSSSSAARFTSPATETETPRRGTAAPTTEGTRRRAGAVGDLFRDVEPESGGPIPLAGRRRTTGL